MALVLAPGLFRNHIDRTVGPIPAEVDGHLQTAFARATLISLTIRVLTAVLTGLAVSCYVTRRVVGRVTAMAQAASEVAAGSYSTQVTESGWPKSLYSGLRLDGEGTG